MYKMLLKVKDDKSCYRDSETNAIIINDDSAYTHYQTQRAYRQKQKMKEVERDQEINHLKHEINNIKGMLELILSKI